jgi:hypothetical protein
MDIKEFIEEEVRYFKPILERYTDATMEMRDQWRKETLAERSLRVSLEAFDLCNGVVQYGPFAGMHLNRETWWGAEDLGSQCFGLYEKELLDLIDSGEQWDTFIDIGAADGYYAVGMLLAGKASKVICFETSEHGQRAIDENWKLNGAIGDLEIHGTADELSLRSECSNLSEKTLVMVDIEGFEFDLLTAPVLDALCRCEIILEVHNWVDDFELKYRSLLERLDTYFDIRIIERVDRTTANLLELRDFTDDNRMLVVSERRPCLMRFLHMTPKDKLA